MSSQPDPVINIVGEWVLLGPPSRDQLPAYQRWFSDMNTMRTQGDPEPGPRTIEEIATWYDSEMSGRSDRHWFSIYDRQSMRHIGFVDLHHIDFRHRTATMSMMVGEPEYRGRGYGTEMAKLILDYGFNDLALHNVMLECYEFNLGRRAYEKAGFREFARRSQAHYMGGRYWDIIFMEAVNGQRDQA